MTTLKRSEKEIKAVVHMLVRSLATWWIDWIQHGEATQRWMKTAKEAIDIYPD